MSRIVVIGSGLAGMASALMAREAGHTVTIVSQGMGGLLLSNGTLDVLGWASPSSQAQPIRDIPQGFADFVNEHPYHPYRQIGFAHTSAGVSWLTRHLGFFDSYDPDALRTNVFVPTAVGAVRPVAVVPHAMRASVLTDGDKVVVVGLRRIKDFSAELVADNLMRSPFVKIQARGITLDVPVRNGEVDASGTTYARAFDKKTLSGERGSLISMLKQEVREGEKVLIPAVMGIDPSTFTDFAQELGVPVGEIPLPPPSVAGRRIHQALTDMCREARIDIQLNAVVKGFSADGDKISALKVQRAVGACQMHADAFIDAAGGFESGNLERDSYLRMKETIFDLPLYVHDAPEPDFSGDGIFRSGVMVSPAMRPTNNDGEELYSNLYCVGGVLGGALEWEEKSGEGIALGSSYAAVQAISA